MTVQTETGKFIVSSPASRFVPEQRKMESRPWTWLCVIRPWTREDGKSARDLTVCEAAEEEDATRT